MLKQLNIKNLILIEFLEVNLSSGFNVITGETGAGKSAIISAIKLICGDRSDTKLIRKNEEKAVVEASFSLNRDSQVFQILQESGIEYDDFEDIIIRREILSTGKSKAYINHQMAQISLLKKIGEKLIHIVGQHANQKLFSLEEHRNIIDIFGGYKEVLLEYQSLWLKQTQIKEKLKNLIEGEAARIREIERLEQEIDEIIIAKLQENEEEELFSEFTLLTQKEEIIKKSQSLLDFFEKGNQSLNVQLSKKLDVFSSLVAIDKSLEECYKLFKTSVVELQEVSYSLNQYLSQFENDPYRIDFLSERLALINKLKKKYGNSISDIFSYLEQAKNRLKELYNYENDIESLHQLNTHLVDDLSKVSNKVTILRKNTAVDFEQKIMVELKELNLPNIQFKVQILDQEPSIHGNEKIEFYFAPNLGEKMIPVRESASGGELSRVVLALETLLSLKNDVNTIIFDEIDSNIGGETAAIIGQKIKYISLSNQVICITHFSQVAQQAETHFLIEKREEKGRTLSFLEILDLNKKEKELYRMIGKK